MKIINGKLGIEPVAGGGGNPIIGCGFRKSMRIPIPSTIIPLSFISMIWLERNKRKTIMMLKTIIMFDSFLDAILASWLGMLLFAYLVLEPIETFDYFASQETLCQIFFTNTPFSMN